MWMKDLTPASSFEACRNPTLKTGVCTAIKWKLTRPTAELRPADVKFFGGKATNFGTLRRSIPQNSPNALGISFDLWDAFIAQKLPSGKTLQQEVDARLGNLSFPTDVRVLERLRGATLVECVLSTGRQHQIRIHLAEDGHALVGERVYVRDYASTQIEAERPMLHAYRLGFVHPRTEEIVRFESPLPPDFESTRSRLR